MNTKTETQECGCKTVTEVDNEGVTLNHNFIPCLGCALTSAGLMLIQAGERIHEAAAQQREEEAAEQERIRARAEGFIGGSD